MFVHSKAAIVVILRPIKDLAAGAGIDRVSCIYGIASIVCFRNDIKVMSNFNFLIFE